MRLRIGQNQRQGDWKPIWRTPLPQAVELYNIDQAPEGKPGNWLATVPGKGYFAILRLYGPTEPAINKSWKPGDIEKVK